MGLAKSSHGRIRSDTVFHLRLVDALRGLPIAVDFALQQMVFHALYVIGTDVLLAVQTKGSFLCVILILDKDQVSPSYLGMEDDGL